MIPPFLKKTSWQRSTPLLFRIDMCLIKLNRRCWRPKRVPGEDTVAVQPPYYATSRPTTSHSAPKLVDQRRAASRHILLQLATVRQDQAVNKLRESPLWTLATDSNVAVMATSRLALLYVQFPTKAQQCLFQQQQSWKALSLCNNATFLTTKLLHIMFESSWGQHSYPLSTLVHGALLVFTTHTPYSTSCNTTLTRHFNDTCSRTLWRSSSKSCRMFSVWEWETEWYWKACLFV